MSGGPFDQDFADTRGSLLDASGRSAQAPGDDGDDPVVVPPADAVAEVAAEAAAEATEDPAASPAGDPVAAGPDREAWTGGGFTPYEVGDPGRAAREVVAGAPENPSDPSDTQIDGATVGRLVVRAASVRGISHRHDGTPRQDDYAFCTTKDGSWLVVAVADGVSSGTLSHQAATLACRTAGALVRDSLAVDGPEAIDWPEISNAIAKRIVGHGRRVLGADDSEDISAVEVARTMATTLVVTVIATAPSGGGGHPGVLMAIGDTSAFVLDPTRAWRPLTDVKNDGAAVASSATIALPYVPTDPLMAHAFSIVPGEALFVMTDGIGDPLGRGEGDVGDFLGEAWAAPPDLISFGGQVGFARRSYDDDRTTVGIWVAA